MTLAFARAMSPETPYLMAALIGGRRRPRQRPGAKDWLRIANRLAAGLPARAAALPEGGDEQLVERLLEREEFRAFVGASVDCLAEPAEIQRRRLVLLARQTLERALASDDAPVAVFVLEEEVHDRDPAVTLAEGVMKARTRAARPPAATPSQAPSRPLSLGSAAPDYAARRRPPARRYRGRGRHPPRRHPGRGRAAPHYRRRRAATPWALEAGRRAPDLALRHGLFVYADTGELVEFDPEPQEGEPRQAQAP